MDCKVPEKWRLTKIFSNFENGLKPAYNQIIFFLMDAIISYVNGLDPLWLQDYQKYCNTPIMAKRFRDWGTLKYLLRGIETHMKFVENVYLLVARDSQVPEWADTDRLKIVRHEDIMPHDKLPTFNSSMIEMFLHRIPGLDEKYLYFNDDMFPVSHCEEDDFFPDGKGSIGFVKTYFTGSKYKKLSKDSDHLARRALGQKPSFVFLRPQHTVSPMLRSACEELYAKEEQAILDSCSRIRADGNFNQYAFLDYMYYSGRAVSRRTGSRYCSLASTPLGMILGSIEKPSSKIICINDVKLSDERFERYRKELVDTFERVFPAKSRFEK